ncbi:MAG TPA: Ca2+-dependent phosphoinositide-specific phospholipase C [Polyangia bacterium]|nr:Ca2+-dependent phosphoinositide-specific phospholipase C [Polyangia bacterium]
MGLTVACSSASPQKIAGDGGGVDAAGGRTGGDVAGGDVTAGADAGTGGNRGGDVDDVRSSAGEGQTTTDGGGDGRVTVDMSVRPDVPPLDGAGVPMNGLQVGGTHNSYHLAPTIAFHPSHAYSHKPLNEQLAGGMRALELDVHLRTDGTFDVYHIALIDPQVTCSTFEECLGTIATWSSAHPSHVPIFIWVEIKDDTGGSPINDPQTLEPVILKVFARERLITPAWLRGNFASPRERIMTAGWPRLDEARGKIMFSIVNRDKRTVAYSHDSTSLDDRLMFVSAQADQFDMPWAVVTEVNPDDAATVMRAQASRLMTVANICAIDMTDAACQQRLTAAVQNGVHMLKDDLPFPVSGRTYTLKLPSGSPGCNPVTAPPGCTVPLE